VKALVGPDIPSNAGAHRPIHIDAPLGSVVNAQPPAAVNGRVETAQRVIDVMFGALAEALPGRATGAHNGAITGVHFSGVNPRTGKYYVYLETFGGGFGARASKDGLDGVQVHSGNTSNLPVEAVESEYPIMVEAYELIDDSGGAGRTRGGLGLHRRLRLLDGEAEFWLDGSRMRSAPWGIFGGQPGGRLDVQVSEGVPAIDHGRTTLRAGQAVSIRTAGAGGYGDPHERDPELVRRDVREGKVSASVARDVYRVDAPLAESSTSSSG
jgi:N-methylhydantoinase B